MKSKIAEIYNINFLTIEETKNLRHTYNSVCFFCHIKFERVPWRKSFFFSMTYSIS